MSLDGPAQARLVPLGVVWAIWSGFRLVLGLVVLGLGIALPFLLASLPPGAEDPPPPFVFVVFGGILGLVGLLAAALGGFGVAVGLSLRHGRTWALYGACVLGVFGLANFPVGMALGVWTLVVAIPEIQRGAARA